MCKITSLPNPHIYWVVIFVQVYIIALGIIIMSISSANISQYNKLDGKLLPESSISVIGVSFATLLVVAGISGIGLVIYWKWKYIVFHSTVVLLLALIFFITGIYWFATFNRENFISDLHDKIITNFGGQTGNADVNSTQFSSIQKYFQCCGLNSWRDYRTRHSKEFTIPVSCCKNCEEGDILHFTKDKDVTAEQIYEHGCLMKLLVFSTVTVSELRLYFICSVLPITQMGILLAILAHFIRYRYM